MPKMMFLPVAIDDTEKLRVLAEVSEKLTEVEKLEAEKKRLPEAIKSLLGAIHIQNHALAAGVIEREVEIREEANPFSAKVKIFRVDTGEFVKERDMDPEEAQMQLGQSSVPGPAPDNVRSLSENREKTEEQLAAGTPEEAESLRAARLADEKEQRVLDLVAGLTIEVLDRGDGTFVAQVMAGEIPGIADAVRRSGPIRSDSGSALTELVREIRRMILGSGAVDPAPAGDDVARTEAADDAANKTKRLLKAPKGAKGKKLKIQNGKGEPLPPTDPDGLAF